MMKRMWMLPTNGGTLSPIAGGCGQAVLAWVYRNEALGGHLDARSFAKYAAADGTSTGAVRKTPNLADPENPSTAPQRYRKLPLESARAEGVSIPSKMFPWGT
jgi:hypothetical protein